MKSINIFLSIIISLFPLFLSADDLPQKPNPPKLVNDFVGIFSENDAYKLEQDLIQFNRETSTQIAIVVVDDLKGYDPSDYTTRLAEKWKIGQKGKDNGILIMIKPTGNSGERHAFIAVGYGLEGIIPDAIANRIVDNEMIPQFEIENYYSGVIKAVSVLKSLSLKEYSAADYTEKHHASSQGNGGGKSRAWFLLLVMLVFFFVKPGRSALQYSRTNNLGFWAAFWLILSSGSTTNDNHWNHFHGGSGGFGGFGGGGFGGSGGGFGGFGGGSFGGGGAGGSW